MRTVMLAIVGASLGLLATSFGLIDTSTGQIVIQHGNQWTPLLALVGVVGGGFLAIRFARSHLLVLLGATLGLALAIPLRDAISLNRIFGPTSGIPVADFTSPRQPSEVIILTVMVLVVGVGALAGTFVQRARSARATNSS